MARRTAEYGKWVEGQYPYDLAVCGECAAGHGFGQCRQPDHAAMVAEAETLKLTSIIQRGIQPSDREKFASFREKFAQFYEKA